MADKPIRLALIGCGSYGLGSYAPALASFITAHQGVVEPVAACDTQIERAQQAVEQFGFAAACDDVAAMIRDHKPDLCICPLPKDETLMQGSQLLAQNMKCVFELPLGDSIDEVMEIADAAREMGTAHAVNLSRRFSPLLLAAGKYARQVGKIVSAECTIEHTGSNDRDELLAHLPHGLDAIFSLVGTSGVHSASQDKAVTAIDLKFPGGEIGRIELSGEHGDATEKYAITGETYRLEVVLSAPEGPSIKAWRCKKQEIDITGTENMPDNGCGGLYELIEDFLGSLTNNEKAQAPAIDDCTAIVDITCQVADEIYQTA